METTVRYIPTQNVVVDGHDYTVGNKPALCFRGKKYAVGIINAEEGIHPVMLTLRDHDLSRLVMLQEEEYPVYKFIAHIQRMAETKPIDPEALRLISQWPNTPEDFGDPVITEEEPAKPAKIMGPRFKKPNCIAVISQEMGVAATKIRKFLRSQGMKAPYEDEKKIRSALKGYK